MTRLALLRDRDARDAGMTLAELLAYMILSGIVLAVVGTLLVRSLMVQRDVTAQTQASGAAQVVLTDIQGALRNAVSVTVPSAFGGDLLLMKTRVGDEDVATSFQCRGWYLDASTGELRTVTGTPGAGAPTKDLTPASDLSTWRVQIADVHRASDGGTDLPVFAAEGATGAQVRFEVVDGPDGSTTTLTSAAVPRPQGTSTGADACF